MKLLGDRQGFIWQAIIVFLILLDGIILALALISNLKIVSLQYIGIIDLFVSVILLLSFIVALIRSGDIKHNLIKNWPLIFSFIPIFFIVFAVGQERYIFIIKFFNILKIVSLYLYAKKFANGIIKYQEKTRLVYAIATFLLVLFICSFIFFVAEHGVNPEVANYEDSIWFVLQTITTVGYGDIIPVTNVGRIMGVISMLSALILTSIVTSVATFSLIEKFKKGTEALTQKTKEHVELLDEKIDKIDADLKDMHLDKIQELNKDVKDLKKDINEIKEFIRKNNR
ncbi:MAG: ion channel [Methanothermobacter sp.]